VRNPAAQEIPPDAAERVRASLAESARLKAAVAEALAAPIARAAHWIAQCYRAGHKTLLFGNGGSASDALHIAAEWTGRFGGERPALPAIALPANASETTAIANDYGFERVFARGIEAHGRPGDVALAFSTSGNSPNLLRAAVAAQSAGLRSIAFLGKGGGALRDCVDLALVVPSAETARIQECHIAMGHCIAELVDAWLFPDAAQP